MVGCRIQQLQAEIESLKIQLMELTRLKEVRSQPPPPLLSLYPQELARLSAELEAATAELTELRAQVPEVHCAIHVYTIAALWCPSG